MKNITSFDSFFPNFGVQKIQEDWRGPEYEEEAPEPDEPKISYSSGQQLFDLVADVPYLCFTLLKGKPAVGGGVWVLSHDCGVPADYLYGYGWLDDRDISYDEKLTPDSHQNWATDIWKNEKSRIGSGAVDFYLDDVDTTGWKSEDYKLLIKVDPELKERLIEDLEDGLSLRYEKRNEIFGPSPYNLGAQNREDMKKALYFLERSPV